MAYTHGKLYDSEIAHFKPVTDAGFEVELGIPDAGENTYVITHPDVPGKRHLVSLIHIDVDKLKQEFGLV